MNNYYCNLVTLFSLGNEYRLRSSLHDRMAEEDELNSLNMNIIPLKFWHDRKEQFSLALEGKAG
jgi:hypothetical protein